MPFAFLVVGAAGWAIARKDLVFGQRLGGGEFGGTLSSLLVYLAYMVTCVNSDNSSGGLVCLYYFLILLHQYRLVYIRVLCLVSMSCILARYL